METSLKEKIESLQFEAGELRRIASPVMIKYAHLDPFKVDLQHIGNSLRCMYDELTDTRIKLAQERDDRKKLVEQETSRLRIALTDKERDHAEVVAQLNDEKHQHEVTKRDLAERHEQNRLKLEHDAITMREQVEVARATLRAVLSRPNALLKIFGVELYQSFKDSYMMMGGDATALPMPRPRNPEDEGDGS